MEFCRGNLGIAEVASVLKMDSQTVRVLIQQELVPWGKAYRLPGSKRYGYLISPKGFYEATGVMLGGRTDDK